MVLISMVHYLGMVTTPVALGKGNMRKVMSMVISKYLGIIQIYGMGALGGIITGLGTQQSQEKTGLIL